MTYDYECTKCKNSYTIERTEKVDKIVGYLNVEDAVKL